MATAKSVGSGRSCAWARASSHVRTKSNATSGREALSRPLSDTSTNLCRGIEVLLLAMLLLISFLPSATHAESKYIRKGPVADRVIVFMHGILGDSVSAWTNTKNSAYWPSLIVADPTFNGNNVYVYEYPSPFLGKSFSLDEVAENFRLIAESDALVNHKEIIFLSHSQGGLVARAFLLKYRDYARLVRFMYFFATPTEGSPSVSLAALITNNPQFGQLYPMESDGYLADLQRSWLAAKLPIRSFCAYEKLETYGFMIVDQRSATNLCNERLDPITEDHIQIVKPQHQKSTAYRAFKEAYRLSRGDSPSLAQREVARNEPPSSKEVTGPRGKPEPKREVAVAKPKPSEQGLIRDIQKGLQKVGCFDTVPTGNWGPMTRLAAETFNAHAKESISVEGPNADTLRILQETNARVCPEKCKTTEAEKAGHCVIRSELESERKTLQDSLEAWEAKAQRDGCFGPSASPPREALQGTAQCMKFLKAEKAALKTLYDKSQGVMIRRSCYAPEGREGVFDALFGERRMRATDICLYFNEVDSAISNRLSQIAALENVEKRAPKRKTDPVKSGQSGQRPKAISTEELRNCREWGGWRIGQTCQKDGRRCTVVGLELNRSHWQCE